MTEKELQRLYGEDYVPQSRITIEGLRLDEETWVQSYGITEDKYDYQYSILGLRRKSNG